MPDRSGGGSSNCGARRILSFFGLNIYEKKVFFSSYHQICTKKTHVNLNKAGCSLNIFDSLSVSKRKSFFVTSFL